MRGGRGDVRDEMYQRPVVTGVSDKGAGLERLTKTAEFISRGVRFELQLGKIVIKWENLGLFKISFLVFWLAEPKSTEN